MRRPGHSGCGRRPVERLCLRDCVLVLLANVAGGGGQVCALHTCCGAVDAGNVVHASYDKVGTIGRPGKVVDLGAGGPTHLLGPPRLLVLRAVGAKGRGHKRVALNPENDVAIVASRGEQLAWNRSVSQSVRKPTSCCLLGRGVRGADREQVPSTAYPLEPTGRR